MGPCFRRDDEVRYRGSPFISLIQFSNSRSHSFAISPRVSREVWPARSALLFRGRRECRAPDAPNSRVCRSSGVEHTRCQVTPEIARHSPRNGLRLTSCSSRRSAFLSPSSLRSLLLGNLTPAPRRQNHTTSPSASRAIRQERIRVHRILSRVRDDLEPPLCGTGRSRC
jgi:hypothetical protein